MLNCLDAGCFRVLQYHGDIEGICQLREISKERPLTCFFLTPPSFSIPGFLLVQFLISCTFLFFFFLYWRACSNVQEGSDL